MTWSPHWHWAHRVFMTNISFHLPSWSCDKMLDYFHGLLYPASGTSNTMSQNVGGSEREAEIIMFFLKNHISTSCPGLRSVVFHFKNIQTNMNHANTSQARLGPQQTQFLRWISQFLKISPRPIYWKWLYYNSHIQEKLFARKLLHVQTNLGIRFLHPTNMNINQRWDSPFSTLPDFCLVVCLVSLCMFVNK